MPAGLFTKIVLIFALKDKPSSSNTAKSKRFLILTANRCVTPQKTQKKAEE
jgi:hypothetical protein